MNPDSLASRVKSMKASATVAMSQKAREMSNQGIDVINLSLGEPDFHTPEHIKEGGIQGIRENYTSYPPIPGYLDLREGIAAKMKRDNKLDYTAKQIVVSTGAKQSIANVMLCMLDPGDEVIVFTPYWVSYISLIKLSGGIPVLVEGPLENNFKINPDDLKSAITPKTKAIIFSSPSNPTGSVYSKEELGVIAGIVKNYPNIMVISDEIYEYINYIGDHASIASFDEIKDQVVVVNGFSKGFAMTGWRVGYIAAPLELAAACDKIQGQFTSATCSIAQRASLTAITSGLEKTMEMKEAFRKRRDIVFDLLNEIPGIKTYVPDGAFYFFPEIDYYFGKRKGDFVIKDSVDFCTYLLEDSRVSTVAGSAFGAPKCFRISFAASEVQLVEALARIKKSLSELV
jgi:aspartate aminotransferase